MITKEEKLEVFEALDQQKKHGSPCPPYYTSNQIKYLLDLITRDWKCQGHMRKPYQVRNEMEHQKRLATKCDALDQLYGKYMTRVHLLSWVLGDSDTF